MPDKCYTLTQAARALPDILSFVEDGHSVELTRHGKSVAVVISVAEYQSAHVARTGDFWQALQQFRQQYAADLFDMSDALADIRESSAGREMAW